MAEWVHFKKKKKKKVTDDMIMSEVKLKSCQVLRQLLYVKVLSASAPLINHLVRMKPEACLDSGSWQRTVYTVIHQVILSTHWQSH